MAHFLIRSRDTHRAMGLLLAALFSLSLGCNPLEFDTLADTASTRVSQRPDGFTSERPFGSVLTGYEVTIDGQRVSRLAVGGGPGSPVVVYQGWVGSDIVLGPPLYDACDDSGDCLETAGGALIGVPTWRAASASPGNACLMITAPGEGGYSITCESAQVVENLPGTMAGLEVGASGVGLGAGNAVGIALLGAPRANGGAGGVFRVEDGRPPSELGLPPGTAPPSARLGTDIDAVSLGADSALVAATAPEGRRVVVFTVRGDGSTDVHACIDEAAAGFAGSVAVGDVDGDGVPDVVVGNTNEGADEVRIYAGSSMPAMGCGAWGAAPSVVACPEVLGVTCNGSGFGADVAVGDVDGDGDGDLVVGAPFADVGESARAGAVFFLPGGAGGPDRSAATARTHSSPELDDAVGSHLALLPSGLGVAERVEPVAGSIGRQAVLSFLCSGLDGDKPADTDRVGERCIPRAAP